MTEKRNKPRQSANPQAAELRRKSEEALQKQRAIRTPVSPDDAQRLLHELEVHQIELEMQNEELRRTLEELDAVRARYFNLYDLAPVGYCTVSEQGLLLEANLTIATLLGAARGELAGLQNFPRLIHKDDQDIYYHCRKQLFETGEPQACVLRMVKKNGMAFWAHLDATVSQDDDGAQVCRVVLNDITGRKQAEQALKRSEYRQRAILNNIPDIAWIKDNDGKYIAVNEAFAQSAGCAAGDIIGKTDHDLWPPELAAQYRADDLQIHQTRQRIVFEEQLVSHEGAAIMMESIKTPLYDDSGNLTGTAGIARDITQRVKAAEELRMASEKWRTTFDAMLDPVALLDAEGTVAQCNRAFVDCLNLDFPAVLGRKCSRLIHGTEDHIPGCPVVKARKSGRRETMELQIGEKFFLVVADPAKDSGGNIQGFVHIMRDITERKLAEQELYELKLAIEQSRDGIAFADLDGRVRFANDAWARMHGYAAAELTGRHLSMFHTQEQLEREVNPFNEYALAHGSKAGEVGHIRKDGTIFPTWMSSTAVAFEGVKASGWLGIARDITDRKLAEQALQTKNAELERFTYSVSHDLRSPLITIRTFMGHLVEDMARGDKERVAEDMGYINGASRKMAELLDELLQLSRIGRMVTPSVDAPLQDIVREVLCLVAGQIAERGVKVEVTQTPLLLHGDRPRLVEVFQNLIDNAVKFMGDQKEPKIEIGLKVKSGETLLFVRDNGMGIDPRHRDKLFGLFEKLNPEIEGTGMGLALAKRIVEVHGGRIWVESEGPGTGACFWFSLPGKEV